jgi:hypothetical protein
LHAALHEHEGFFVIKEDAGVHELLAQRQHFGGGRAGIFLRLVAGGGQRDVFHKVKRVSFLFLLISRGSLGVSGEMFNAQYSARLDHTAINTD